MKDTSVLVKLFTSIINVVFAFVISTPLFIFFGFDTIWKISIIIIFFLIEMLFTITKKGRDFGMLVMGTYWAKRPTFWAAILYNFLYTASFATLLFSVWFPFDLFLINMFFVQLPIVVIKGNTLHGSIAGLQTVG